MRIQERNGPSAARAALGTSGRHGLGRPPAGLLMRQGGTQNERVPRHRFRHRGAGWSSNESHCGPSTPPPGAAILVGSFTGQPPDDLGMTVRA